MKNKKTFIIGVIIASIISTTYVYNCLVNKNYFGYEHFITFDGYHFKVEYSIKYKTKIIDNFNGKHDEYSKCVVYWSKSLISRYFATEFYSNFKDKNKRISDINKELELFTKENSKLFCGDKFSIQIINIK